MLEAQGGGNCGNALTAAARLGLAPAIVTKIGGDGVGDGILAEFKGDGVDTQYVLRAAGAPSPFTYIIVDRQGGTRTCIHTPGEPMQPEELIPELAAAVLDGAALVYFDGRLTEAAVVLAAAARERGVPVLVEAERLRPGLEQLLGMADYVVSSAHFPQSWTGEQCLGDALLATLSRLPRARWLITTLGSRGSVLLERPSGSSNGAAAAAAAEPAVLDDLAEQLFSEAASSSSSEEQGGPACVSASGIEIGASRQASSSGARSLRLRRGEAETQGVLQAAQVAAASAAAANADASNAAGYAMQNEAGGSSAGAAAEVVASVTVSQAAQLPAEAVVDTTGAGDAFIGSILYGLATGMPVRRAMQLAAVVAACKCTALGARPGLPRRANLRADLLGA
ncbi:pfkB family carbohydrate kinase [Chlorella sorokiniana]|uniref:PfkB family carbohydrate kinase n=1 Tax=Chlorella sorokiniana TaxID=3076 RepID=A0A2P6U0U5_CHLSO|nr:pfkB family carbohydrate kinase [Chlorella sorokiniana]|eukprot:PRW59942.1 pfkB family carbohydrate kinase [Chlorella sorokiniana]